MFILSVQNFVIRDYSSKLQMGRVRVWDILVLPQPPSLIDEAPCKHYQPLPRPSSISLAKHRRTPKQMQNPTKRTRNAPIMICTQIERVDRGPDLEVDGLILSDRLISLRGLSDCDSRSSFVE